MKIISGGVCAAAGFRAGARHCGVKQTTDAAQSAKKDVAIIAADCECTAAAVYTLNRVKAAPIYVTMEHLEDGVARAIIVNSGNANACAPNGMENARRMAQAAAKHLGIDEKQVIVASTGVIGQTLDIACIEQGVAQIELLENGSQDASQAMMTTDTREKSVAVEFVTSGKTCRLGGICKGSGMIHPNMGTMLCFITTDCAITQQMLHDALTDATRKTFNRVSVDGDTSTNDMCTVLASGKAGNTLIDWQDENYAAFYEALLAVMTRLARMVAADGEGASKLIACTVSDARSEEAAERLAKAVISSSLVKAAMFGADANWGRVLCAMGYSKAPFRPEYVTVSFCSDAGSVTVCEKGAGLSFDEETAKKVLSQSEITIEVDLHEGDAQATAWGCDLTYDYVKINGDYRT